MVEQYPKWLTHPNGHSLVVQSFDDHQTRAAEGYLTADEYDALVASATPTALPEVDGPSGDITTTVADAPLAGPEAFETLSAVDAIGRIADTSDPDALRGYRALEENRANGGRKTVLRALADKLGDTVAADLPDQPDQIGAAGE